MSTPGLVQHVVWGNSSNSEPSGGNAFKLPLPNATLSGNCLVLKLYYPDSVTTVTVTDDQSNSWPSSPTVSVDDPSNSMRLSVFVLPNATAGVNVITVTFNAVIYGFNPAFLEWYNVATSSPLDGSHTATQIGASPVASGSFNTTADGDLILHFVACNDYGTQGSSGYFDGVSLFTKASGYTLCQTDLVQGYCCEYQIQGTHGATNPALGITWSTGNPTDFSSITLALKSATAGTAPGTGVRVLGLVHMKFVNVGGGSGTGNWSVQFPTVGNTFAYLATDPKGSIEVTGITGSVSGSWPGVYAPDAACPVAVYKAAGTASTDEMLTVAVTDHATHGYDEGCFYDIVNGGAYDTANFATSSATFGPGNTPNMPAITPGVSSGIVLNSVMLNTGPPDSLVSPAGRFLSVKYTNETDLSSMDNGDCHGCYVFGSNATQNWVYHNTVSSDGCDGIALSFAAGSTTTEATVAVTDAPDACAVVGDSGSLGATVAATDAADFAAISAIVPTIGEIMVGTKVNGTTSVSNLAMPAAAVNGDVLLAFIVDHGTSGTTAAPNAGWSNVGATAAAAGRFQVFKGVVGQGSIGNSPWTWTGLTTRSMGRIIAYHGADQTTPIDVTVSARNNASGTTGAASITPVTAGAKIVAAYASLANGTTWSAEACATQPTLAEWADSANSTYCSLAIADGLETTAGATGDSSATMATPVANAGMLIALRPAAVAGAVAATDAPDVAAVQGSAQTATSAAIAAVDAPDTAAVATTVTTGAALAPTDAPDVAAAAAAIWTTASAAATDAADTAAIAASVTTGGAVAATDGHDTAALQASVNVGTIVATDGADTSSIATTVTTGAAIAATDAADAAAIGAAGTVGSVAGTDAADAVSVAATVTTGAAVATSDAADVCALQANANLSATSGAIAAVDAADIAAAATSVTTGAAVAAADAADTAAAQAAIWTTAQIVATDAVDAAAAGATVTTGAAVSTSDAADVASVQANANLGVTSATVAAVDAADACSCATSVTTGAAIDATDARDLASILAAPWTTADIIVLDAADIVAVLGVSTTGAAVAAIDAADAVAIGTGKLPTGVRLVLGAESTTRSLSAESATLRLGGERTTLVEK